MLNNINIKNNEVEAGLLLGYEPKESELLYGKVLPDVPVGTTSGDLMELGTEHLRIIDDLSSFATETPLLAFTMSKETKFRLELHALKTLLDYEQSKQYGSMDAYKRSAWKRLIAALKINRENALATAMTSTSTMTNYKDLAAAGNVKWTDFDNSNPLKDIMDAKSVIAGKIGIEPNTITMSGDVWRTLRMNPKMLSLLKITDGMMTLEHAKTILEVKEILVSDALKETANVGQTSSLGKIWGNDCTLFYKNPNPEPDMAEKSFGYNFVPDDKYRGLFVDTYIPGDPIGAEYARAALQFDGVILDVNASYLLKNCK